MIGSSGCPKSRLMVILLKLEDDGIFGRDGVLEGTREGTVGIEGGEVMIGIDGGELINGINGAVVDEVGIDGIVGDEKDGRDGIGGGCKDISTCPELDD